MSKDSIVSIKIKVQVQHYSGTRNVECVNYDGSGRQVIFNDAQYPFDVTFANDNYYWTDWEM